MSIVTATVALTVDGTCEKFRAKLILAPWFSYEDERGEQRGERNIWGSLQYKMHGNQFNTEKDKLTPALKISIEEHVHYKDGLEYHSYDLVSLEGDRFKGKTVSVTYVNAGEGVPPNREAGKPLTIPPHGGAAQLKL